MSKKGMIKLINQLSYKQPTWQIFTDFLELSALAISNSVDYRKYREREEKYKFIMQKYSEEERRIFPQMLTELTITLEENISDVLGELFMELELGNKWGGQFFTPYHLCLLTTEIASENVDKIINKNGFIELNEPACGGGAMVIAFAETMKRKGYNFQQQLKVTCQDLDIKSVYMSYIQLSLLGIPAQVCHANTLSLEVFDIYRTPLWVLGGWGYREPKKEHNIELSTEETGQLKII